jgi:chromosome segregation ATPase
MSELPASLPASSELPSVVDAALKVIAQVTTFLYWTKELTERHEQLRERFDRLEREQDELRQREAVARRESEETAEALAELRGAYEALLAAHETNRQTLQRLDDERAVLLDERRQMAEELGAVIGSLRTSRPHLTLGAGAAEA